jgi:adenosylcobinamide-phosphate synthase
MGDMALNLLLAFLLDCAVGDPAWFPHPVRGIGVSLRFLERATTAVFGRTKFSGMVSGALLVSGTAFVAWGSVKLAGLADPTAAWLAEIFWLWAGISARNLDDAASEVLDALERGDLTGARTALSMIVGRDTEGLDENEIRGAVVETVAENTVDGILSPIFYAAIGGAPALWAFKAVSTGDSMVGYRNPKYREFGWFCAKLDDFANYIPARLSLAFIASAAWLLGLNAVRSVSTALDDARKHDSPNAGIPEAAAAGALGVALGGPASYGGEIKRRPRIGSSHAPPPSPRAARASIRLMWVSAILFLAVAVWVRQFIA